MRAALLILLAPAIAHADVKLPDVMRPAPAHVAKKAAATTGFTSVSHLIYLNNCLPNGCTVIPGNDDATTHHSSIPTAQAHIPGWAWGDASWNALVQCVKDTYAPFDVQITTTDPGTAPHFEVLVGGKGADLDPQVAQAGGVAPYIPCNGEIADSVMTFVFAGETNQLDYLCGAVAQESSHVWGLDHELNAADPMTYLDLGSHKSFQNAAADCGENTPRQCYCGDNKQNSFQYLADTFGPAHLDTAKLAITSPVDGAYVKPGFVITAVPTSQISIVGADLAIDGAPATSVGAAPYVFDAPMSLAGGDHVITVTATDKIGRTFSGEVNVHVLAACGAGCADGTACLGGFCIPNGDVPGGLGASCTSADTCITGQCASDGTTSQCTDHCDAGDTCPSGFSCESGVCWQQASSGGGCSTSPSPALALFGFGALMLSLRRRR